MLNSFLLALFLVPLQKAVGTPLGAAPADDGIQVHAVDAAEDIHIHLGVVPPQAGDELLHLLALGKAGLVSLAHRLGEAAGALEECYWCNYY